MKSKRVKYFLITPEDITRCGGDRQAMLFNYFKGWIKYNAEKKLMQYDGHTWTYFTYGRLREDFSHLSMNTLKRLLSELVARRLLVKERHSGGLGGHCVKVRLHTSPPKMSNG